MRFFHTFFVACFASVLAFSSMHTFAQSYSSGYNKYIQGDFASAENEFKSALQSVTSEQERARILKMLGICQYMLGKRLESESSFKEAKSLNPNIAISASEVLDTAVIDFFGSIQGAPKISASQNGKVQKNASQDDDKITKIKVNANPEGAKILIDGKFTLQDGEEEVINSGIHELEVSMKGYAKITRPISIAPGITNTVNLELKPLKAGKNIEAKKVVSKKKSKKVRVSQNEPGETDAGENSKNSVKKKEKINWSYLDLFPLGVGQWRRDEYWKGAIYTFGQVFGVYYYYTQWVATNKIVQDTNTTLNDRIVQESQIPDQAARTKYHQGTETYRDNSVKKVSAAIEQAYIGMVIAGIFWIGSIGDAYFSNSSGNVKKIKKTKVKTAYSLKLETDIAESLSEEKEAQKSGASGFQFAISPYPMIETKDHHTYGLLLHMEYKF